ncbi:hypothetical protein LguiA_018968 [Lonicera macranthoides]
MSGLASCPWTLLGTTFPRFSPSSKSSSSSFSSYSSSSVYSDNSKLLSLLSTYKSRGPSYNCCGVVDCRSQFAAAPNDLRFVLHDALDSSDVNTTHARSEWASLDDKGGGPGRYLVRVSPGFHIKNMGQSEKAPLFRSCIFDALSSCQAARERFGSQIKKLSVVERGTSISINREVDLGETALYIAAEDDSLISHSSVPLPVEAFIERLDDLSMDYCSHYSSSFRSSPEKFLECLDRYLYFDKVLTHRLGSASMLSLVYSEILKMLRLWGLVSFDVEIFFPHDSHSSPRGYLKQKSKESDQLHIMTTQSLLVEVTSACLLCSCLASDSEDTLALIEPNFTIILYAHIGLGYGYGHGWDTARVRHVILRDLKDAFWPFHRDRTKSLFLRAAEAANCYDRSNDVNESGFELASAKAARHRLERGVWTTVRFGDMRRALAGIAIEEEEAVEKLIIRLNLIMSEEGWTRPSAGKYLHNSSEPW